MTILLILISFIFNLFLTRVANIALTINNEGKNKMKNDMHICRLEKEGSVSAAEKCSGLYSDDFSCIIERVRLTVLVFRVCLHRNH